MDKSLHWKKSLPTLAAGLLTPHEGKAVIEAACASATAEDLDNLHKALRSMTVTLLCSKAPSHRLVEWAIVLKAGAVKCRRTFPVASERLVSLRCMILEAAELQDVTEDGLAERPGVVEVVRTLAKAGRSMSINEIAENTSIDHHSTASRVRIGIAAGLIVADHEEWETMKVVVSSESVGQLVPSVR